MKVITGKIFYQDREIEVNVEYEIVNNGIGRYEFWGDVGNHTQVEPEIENIWSNDAALSTLIELDFWAVENMVLTQLELE